MNTTIKEFRSGVDAGFLLRGWDGTQTTEGCTVGKTDNGADNRVYLQLPIPELANTLRIKKAELILTQQSFSDPSGSTMKLGVYRVAAIPEADAIPQQEEILADVHTVKTQTGDVAYTFDITNAVEGAIKGENATRYLMVKPAVELTDVSYVNLYGIGTDNAPTLRLTCEAGFAIEGGYRDYSHSLGRVGQGSVDLISGNLTIQTEDFIWGGNRMPVTLRHLYTGAMRDYFFTGNTNICMNTADFSHMHLGKGWKLNVMQSMVPAVFTHEGSECSGYIFMDENSSETRFRLKEGSLYEGLEDSSLVYDASTGILTQGNEALTFDTAGRLVSIADEYRNTMTVTYEDGKITSVTDGAGRVFTFAYNDASELVSITAPDGTRVQYAYTDDRLTSVTCPDGVTVALTYENGSIKTVTASDGSGIRYAYTGSRITEVQELGTGGVSGTAVSLQYNAAAGTTRLITTEAADGDTPEQTITTVYTFDDEGEVVSSCVYATDLSPVGVSGGVHPYFGDGGTQTFATARNLLSVTSFELAQDNMPVGNSLFGTRRLVFSSNDSQAKDVLGTGHVMDLQPGVYTFSGYVRFTPETGIDKNQGAFLRVLDANKQVVAKTERIYEYGKEYTRLILPFRITEAQTVKLQMCMDGAGTTEVDGIQLNEGECAEPFNLIRNGGFEKRFYWYLPQGAEFYTGEGFHNAGALKLSGDLNAPRYARQNVPVRTERSDRETFTLSGWAKACGLPMANREEGDIQPTFRLRAEIIYADELYGETEPETFTADFSPCTDEWQYVSLQFSKSKYRTVDKLYIHCDYDYNWGEAFFDDIQLVRNSLETRLCAEDFPMETVDAEVADYTASDDDDKNSPPGFDVLKDTYGNPLTETTFHDGEFGTIYRAFEYGNEGNDRIREHDPRGNTTDYTVDPQTSRNETVLDRCGNATAYEYDAMGRTTKVTAMQGENTPLAEVSYAYNPNGDLSAITRGDGMGYALTYTPFHDLESISVNGMENPLIRYTYKSGGGRLKQVTYANGHTMKAGYNALGQLVSEMWYDREEALTAHYRYTYDHQGNIVRSVDILSKKEYNYCYEDGKLIRATESDITLDEANMVIAKEPVNTLRYCYDSEGNLTQKVRIPHTGPHDVRYYENEDERNTVVQVLNSQRGYTSHSKTDSFGRKVFDEIQTGRGNIHRQFLYAPGEANEVFTTAEDYGRLKSAPTTQLVSQIILSDGRTIAYEYDAEERITKVTDSLEGITEYTYDAQGQLLTETRNGVLVNVMTYNKYGNILTKNGETYGYDSVWKDKLITRGNYVYEYDTQGNPIHYAGNRMIWEKGRQLTCIQNGQNQFLYTYNASGIRTSKTVNGVKHSFILDGAKILGEYWDDNALIPLYDNEENVCGILYGDIPYYFLKNLQGDVIAITNQYGETVARYTYDAWGACTVSYDATATPAFEGAEPVNIATVNPFRYRTYYFDTETALYYLQSRYYDPTLGRFISSDDPEIIDGSSDCNIVGANKYAYCLNNPINNTDTHGRIANVIVKMILNFIWGMLGGLLGMYAGDVCTNIINGAKNIFKRIQTIGTYVAEGIRAGCIAIFGNKIVQRIIVAIGTVVIKTVTDVIFGQSNFNWKTFLKDIISGVIIAVILCGAPKLAKQLNKNNGQVKNRLISHIIDFLKSKFQKIINFFKNTFVKRFSISYAKTIFSNIKALVFG